MKPDIELLKSIPIFNKLNSNELLSMQEISSIKELKKDEILFYEGDESKTLHIVIDGEIEVYKVNSKGKEIILRDLEKFINGEITSPDDIKPRYESENNKI